MLTGEGWGRVMKMPPKTLTWCVHARRHGLHVKVMLPVQLINVPPSVSLVHVNTFGRMCCFQAWIKARKFQISPCVPFWDQCSSLFHQEPGDFIYLGKTKLPLLFHRTSKFCKHLIRSGRCRMGERYRGQTHRDGVLKHLIMLTFWNFSLIHFSMLYI